MTKWIFIACGAALWLSGCQQTDTGTPVAAETASVGAVSLPAPTLPAPVEVPATVTHLKGKPPKATTPCAEVPAGTSRLFVIARAVRRLACEPALYFETTAAARKALALPEGVKLEFIGAGGARIEFKGKYAAKDMAAALGIESPVITTGRGGAWAMRNWRLGNNPKDGELDIWKPGIVTIGVSHDYSASDKFGAVKPLTDAEQLRGWISVRMPAELIEAKHDEVAVKMLLRGLAKFARDKTLSSKPPKEAAKGAELTNERFRVSRRSIGTGPAAVHSTDVWTARTFIAAEPLLSALGLSGKIEHEKAHDSDDYVLPNGLDDTHSYKGLKLHLRFDKNKGTKGNSNADFHLSGITVS